MKILILLRVSPIRPTPPVLLMEIMSWLFGNYRDTCIVLPYDTFTSIETSVRLLVVLSCVRSLRRFQETQLSRYRPTFKSERRRILTSDVSATEKVWVSPWQIFFSSLTPETSVIWSILSITWSTFYFDMTNVVQLWLPLYQYLSSNILSIFQITLVQRRPPRVFSSKETRTLSWPGTKWQSSVMTDAETHHLSHAIVNRRESCVATGDPRISPYFIDILRNDLKQGPIRLIVFTFTVITMKYVIRLHLVKDFHSKNSKTWWRLTSYFRLQAKFPVDSWTTFIGSMIQQSDLQLTRWDY